MPFLCKLEGFKKNSVLSSECLRLARSAQAWTSTTFVAKIVCGLRVVEGLGHAYYSFTLSEMSPCVATYIQSFIVSRSYLVMARSQLGINCPPELLQRLRSTAKERHVTVTALVLKWIRIGLDTSDFIGKQSVADTESRFTKIERRLDQLSRQVAALQSRNCSGGRKLRGSSALDRPLKTAWISGRDCPRCFHHLPAFLRVTGRRHRQP
jgi:hypothetical protein